MDDGKKGYTPTDEEAEAIDRSGLEAAWHELQPLKNDELPTLQMVLTCLRAFKAANAATNDAMKTLQAAHPEASHISHFPHITEMVCSALMGLDLDGPDGIPPNSIAGERLWALLQAAKALEAMATVNLALEGYDGISNDYLIDATTMVAEASIRGEPEGA